MFVSVVAAAVTCRVRSVRKAVWMMLWVDSVTLAELPGVRTVSCPELPDPAARGAAACAVCR